MAKKSKLLSALDAHKGRDYEAEKKRKQVKAAEKRKREKARDVDGVREELEKLGASSVDVEGQVEPVSVPKATGKESKGLAEEEDDFEGFSASGRDEVEADQEEKGVSTIPQPVDADLSASEADLESDVPLSDLGEEDREDVIPYQRMTINNGPALLKSRDRIRVVRPKMRFSAHNSLISTLPPACTAIPDPNDDLTRELEFYRICRTAAIDAHTLLTKEGVPFTRPSDYFAEMVKSDEHMGKVKKKMYDEAASKKAASEARALRDAKKFGKAVQVAKEQERAKEKRQTLDKISSLKRSMSPYFGLPPSRHIAKEVCRTERTRHWPSQRGRRPVPEHRRRAAGQHGSSRRPRTRPRKRRQTTETGPKIWLWRQKAICEKWRRGLNGQYERIFCQKDEARTAGWRCEEARKE